MSDELARLAAENAAMRDRIDLATKVPGDRFPTGGADAVVDAYWGALKDVREAVEALATPASAHLDAVIARAKEEACCGCVQAVSDCENASGTNTIFRGDAIDACNSVRARSLGESK